MINDIKRIRNYVAIFILYLLYQLISTSWSQLFGLLSLIISSVYSFTRIKQSTSKFFIQYNLNGDKQRNWQGK